MAEIRNITKVKEALLRSVERKTAALARGLKKGGLLIQRDSQKIVPVDYGNLKASAFTRAINDGTSKVRVRIGYTAAYALYVHENLDAAHGAVFNAKYAAELAHAAYLRKKRRGGTTGPFRHSRGPNQQAKFLEKPFREDRSAVVAFVKEEIKKG